MAASGEEDIHLLLLVDGILVLVVNLDGVQLASVGEDKQIRWAGSILQLQLCEGGSVALNGLRHVSLLAVELDLACNSAVPLGDADQSTPAAVGDVVDHLAVVERVVSVGELDGVCGANLPVQNLSLGDDANGLSVNPGPEHHGDRELTAAQSLLGLEVEGLEGALLGSHGNHKVGGVHDCRISGDVSSHDIVVVVEIDDCHGVASVGCFPNAELVHVGHVGVETRVRRDRSRSRWTDPSTSRTQSRQTDESGESSC